MQNANYGTVEISSSSTVTPRQAFEQWEGLMSDAVAPSLIQPLHHNHWYGRVTTTQFDGFAVSHMQASAQRALRTQRMVERSTGEFLLVNIVAEGTNWTEQDGRTAACTPGTISFFDSGRPLESHTTDNCVSTLVRAPLQLILDHCGLNRDRLPIATAVPTTGAVGIVADFFRGLAALPPEEVDRAITVFGTDSAAMMASGLLLAAGNTTPAPSDSAYTRRQVFAYIRSRSTDPDLTVDEIARACHISRRTLFRVCEGFGGPAEIVRRVRIEHARRLLRADPARSLAAIAAAAGFSTDRHFYRAFREETGQTPGQFRDQLATESRKR
ncbi:AraC family transcriptional regulator [Nocardia huaxiensis]|uniref:AraC family transcriptional regulator n=1 Tax=Nocardia huaxiensis TaxID=2755382 RepID=A0A7D6V5V2_9NOCA|nr:AraC family transcriptional regulator [Nocardia huaxiensis]QLY28192.1 AraC family transcriptional regulator [Nocardia huaxiensis]UFS98373.1 AraC family transcriptional regulator [Nocardia huaxiensis]